MNAAQRYLESMERSQEYDLLKEMNGTNCAARQIGIFNRGDMVTRTRLDRLEFELKRRAAQRASRLAHRGFEKSRRQEAEGRTQQN